MTMKDYAVFPRNLTARLAHRVAGNPASTRLEDTVANCFPGLELDVRNLDRRFFPGLVFNFAGREHRILPAENPKLYGARLTSLEYESDPDLDPSDPVAMPLLARYHGPDGLHLAQGEWFLRTVEQAGRAIELYETVDGERLPLDGMTVWRIVRSLAPGPVAILLERRDAPAATIRLEAWRRQYVDPRTGTINDVFQPGELVQSLCSPWQHDFRDCACMYWAANRPDVVFGELPKDPEQRLPGGRSNDATRSQMRLDWLRAERGPAGDVPSGRSYYENRPYQMDPHELNRRWTELAIVLEEHETDGRYAPRAIGPTPGEQP